MDRERLEEKMHALGMRPVVTRDGHLEGRAPFENLVNAFTRAPIPAANVRDFGEDSVVFIAPAHLTHLPAIRILVLRNAAAFESEVHALYQRRLEKLREANKFLNSLKLPAELDEPGFRVVSETWVGNEVVRFTLRQGGIVQVLAIAGHSLEGRVDPRLRRIDASKVRTIAALELTLEPLLVKIAAAIAGAGRISVEVEETGEFDETGEAAPPLVRGEESAPRAVAMGAQNELFDHDFTGVLAQDPTDEDTFGGFAQALRERAEDNALPIERGSIVEPDDAPQVVASSDEVPLIALVCGTCGSFYLAEENPADPRLLETCPRCLSG